MKTSVGYFGDNVRSDLLVTVEDATQPTVRVSSSVEAMYGDSIRAQAQRILERFGNPSVSLELQDAGALPFAIEARIECALSKHLGQTLPDLTTPRETGPRNRLRRTRLYVPGNSSKFFASAGLYGADCLIFDLEDSVAPSEKDAARALVRRGLESLDFGTSERTVRINSGEAAHHDLVSVAPANPDTIILPKVECASDVLNVVKHLEELKCASHIIVILESALGVLNALEIVRSSPRIAAMTLGVEDYLADIHATGSEQAEWANRMVLNAARAAGVMPLASVFSKLDDDEGMEQYARSMMHAGFEGVGCIHPRQIQPAHRGFAPSNSEVEQSREIVRTYESALKDGSGVVSVNGRMVDVPIYERAKRTLQRAGVDR
ncbi:MAG: citrate lyase ACP [Armatimonadetes bacterium]|nr:citrate lyase ACP [Armatimonadota bacterium]